MTSRKCPSPLTSRPQKMRSSVVRSDVQAHILRKESAVRERRWRQSVKRGKTRSIVSASAPLAARTAARRTNETPFDPLCTSTWQDLKCLIERAMPRPDPGNSRALLPTCHPMTSIIRFTRSPESGARRLATRRLRAIATTRSTSAARHRQIATSSSGYSAPSPCTTPA